MAPHAQTGYGEQLQRIDAANTRPDFFYADHHVAIYVDGPPHEFPDRQERDARQTEALEDLGYSVLRFGSREGWADLVRRHPSIFGPMPPAPSPTESAEDFDPDLFPPDWRTLLQRLAALDGVRVEPGGDVSGPSGVLGRYIAEVLARSGTSVRLVDSRTPTAKETRAALDGSGHASMSLDPNEADAAARVCREIGIQP